MGKKNSEPSGFIEELASTINTAFKKSSYKAAYFLNMEGLTPTDVSGWVNTGSSMLDLAISNKPSGGFPVGKISEITGLEQSGKSLLASHALASTQRAGGIAVYIDTESAVSYEFLVAIGVKLEKMIYAPFNAIEDVFEAIELIIEKIRSGDKDKLVTIVVDSVMGASTRDELAGRYDKEGYATTKAIIISKAMRKITNMIAREKICLIFTNQLRVRMGASFGDKYSTSGGMAINFHSSVRIRLKVLGQIRAKKDGIDQIIGARTRATVIKNRLGPPKRTIDYDVYFESGIDNYGGWLYVMKDFGLIKQAGSWYTYVFNEKEIKFQSKDFENKLVEIEGLKEDIYSNICDKYIFKYKHKPGDTIGIDDIEIDANFISEDS